MVTEVCELVEDANTNNAEKEIRPTQIAAPLSAATIWRFPIFHPFTFFSGIALGEPGWPG